MSLGRLFRGFLPLAFLATVFGPAHAADGHWKELSRQAEIGFGASVCNTSGKLFSCFLLRCFDDRKLEFAFNFNVGDYQWNPVAEIRVDKGKVFRVPFQTRVEGAWVAAPVTEPDGAELVEALRLGTSFTFDIGYKHKFSLRGSAKQIAATLARCDPPAAPAHSTDLVATSRAYWDTDLPGNDIANGLTDPTLAGLDWTQCRAFCIANPSCRAFTHNGNNNVCILKSAAGKPKPFARATSGIIARPAAVAVAGPLPGAKVVFDDSVVWRGEDTRSTYVERIRAAAVPMGGDCEAERADAAGVAQSLRVTAEDGDAFVGKPVVFHWSSAALSTRIPVYLFVAPDMPSRFAGTGFFALGPGALAPFGIETDGERLRGIVPLFRASAAQQGDITVVPLANGTMSVAASVVAYLRACRETVELRRETIARPVAVATPQIALSDASDHERYPSRIVIPELGRTVLFDEGRMLLVDEKGGEIVERDARDIALSPTRRFLAFSADDHFQVLDLMDGAILARVPGDDLSWGHADSFVVSVTSPWARVWVASTFTEGMLVADGKTACAACWPWDITLIDVNLEDGFILVAGPLGYTMARLDDSVKRLYEANGIVADTGLRGARAPIEGFLNEMGSVSPFSLALRWIVPEGLLRTNGSAMEGETVGKALPRPYVERNAPERLMTAAASLSPMSLVRPKGGGPAAASGRTLLDALGEFGLTVLDEVTTEPEIQPHGVAYDDPGREAADQAFAERQAIVHEAITRDLKSAGIKVKWSGLSGDSFQDELGCPQFEARSGDIAEAVDLAFRLSADRRTLWVVRTGCTVAQTLGTIRTYSEFAVFDSLRPVPVPDAIVETYETMGNLQDPPFYEDAFRAKVAGDRWLVIFTPGGGRITVFDLETRKIVFRQEGVARGDLLSDVHVSSDQRHVLQENADGSFLLYRLDDGALALSGRSVEGEVVFWTPSYHFDSSAEGAELVNLRFPGRAGQYAFQQFDERLRTPGLFQEVMSGAFAATPFPIPAPPELAGSLALGGARIVGTVEVSGVAPVEEVLIFQDGVLTDRVAAGAAGTVAIDVDRRRGARWATVVARDANRLTSTPVGVDLGPDPAGRPGVRLLGVAVDRYDDPTLPPFNYAKKDLLDVFTTLGGLSGSSIDLVSGPELILTDDRATPDAVLAAAESLVRDLGDSEMAVVFFSGHGLRDADGAFYLATTGTDTTRLAETAIPWRQLGAELAKARGRVLVLLDACRSSAAGSLPFADNDAAVRGLKDALPSGLVVLSASKGRENSVESAELRSGLFTDAVLRAIASDRAAADVNGNGAIEVSEFYRAVKDRVVTMRGGQQTPWLSRSRLVGDFALF